MSFDKEKIKQLYPGAEELMFEPMLIQKGTDAQLQAAAATDEWFAQLKKDGALYMYVKGLGGESYLFGRTVSKKTGLLTEKSANVPHIIESLAECLPNGTVVLGEIYYPGKSSKDVTSIMGCLPEKAIERQKGQYGYIHYYIYDTLIYNSSDLRCVGAWSRYEVTKHWYNLLRARPYLELALSITENLYGEIGKALSAGEEGLVFKRKDGIYSPGKRPAWNLKAKQVDFADVIIIDVCDPEKFYTGKEINSWSYWIKRTSNLDDSISREENVPIEQAAAAREAYQEGKTDIYLPVTKHYYFKWKNAIQVGAYDDNNNLVTIGTIASGLTDDIRYELSHHPFYWIGKVCKIQCMSLDKQAHTIRHGFFVSLRDDKNPEQCKLSDIFS